MGGAVSLYPVIKRHGAGRALGFVGLPHPRSVDDLRRCPQRPRRSSPSRHDFAGAAGTDTTALTTTASALVAGKNWSSLLGPGIIAAVNAVCLATIMHRSRLCAPHHPYSGPDRWGPGADNVSIVRDAHGPPRLFRLL